MILMLDAQRNKMVHCNRWKNSMRTILDFEQSRLVRGVLSKYEYSGFEAIEAIEIN
jgi:hypothetical protein